MRFVAGYQQQRKAVDSTSSASDKIWDAQAELLAQLPTFTNRPNERVQVKKRTEIFRAVQRLTVGEAARFST